MPLAVQEAGVILVEDLQQHEDVEQLRVMPGPRHALRPSFVSWMSGMTRSSGQDETKFVGCDADNVDEHSPRDDRVVPAHGGVLEELVGGRFRGQGHRGGRIDDEVQPLVAQDIRLVIPMPADVIRYNW